MNARVLPQPLRARPAAGSSGTGASQTQRRRWPARWLLGALGLGLVLALWEGAVAVLHVPLYVLPAPSVIAGQVVRDWPLLIRHARPTLVEAFGGFAIGNGVAIGLAALFVHWPAVQRSLFPIAIALRTVPLVAITPLLLVWLGNGYAPKIAIAALISFFPTLVNMTRGFGAVDPQTLELLHSLSASRWQIFTKARWPSSLPYLFAALKIAATSCVLGAVIAEWIGSDRGLGYLVIAATFEFRVARLWATIAVTSGIALGAFLLVVAAERVCVRWRSDAGVAS